MTPLSPPPREKTSPLAWGQWVEELWRFLKGLSERSPAGSMLAFGGSTTPDGYLLCDGTAYLTTTYPDLFDAIGNTWDTFNGAADPGDNYFRVPDLRGRTAIGSGTGSGLTARTLATAVGAETHTLSLSEMASHNHGGGSHQHFDGFGGDGVLGGEFGLVSSTTQRFSYESGAFTGAYHPLTSSPQSTVITTQGSDGAHNNMQPSAVVKWIIKT